MRALRVVGEVLFWLALTAAGVALGCYLGARFSLEVPWNELAILD